MKFVLALIFVLIGLILAIASIGTGLYVASDFQYTPLFKCKGTDCVTYNDNCDMRAQLRAADGGLLIIAIILLGISLICASVRACCIVCQIPGNCAGKTVLVLNIISALCLLVVWPIGFALWDAEYCGVAVKKQSNFEIGAHAPLALVAWVFIVIAIVIEFALPDPLPAVGGSDDKKQDEAPKEVKSENAPDAEDKAAVAAAAAEKKRKDDEEAEKKKKAEEEQQQKSKAAEAKPQINWKEINKKLPYEKKEEQKKKRFAMFDEIDTTKTGKVNLEQVTKGMTTVLGLGKELDVPVVIKTAFDKAAAAGQQAGVNEQSEEAGASLEKNEFRLFLMYTRMYFEMYHLFVDLDESGDMAIDLKEFDQALPLLKSWGAQIEDPAATFKQIDKNGKGTVQFKEFVDWALAQGLDCPEDDE